MRALWDLENLGRLGDFLIVEVNCIFEVFSLSLFLGLLGSSLPLLIKKEKEAKRKKLISPSHLRGRVGKVWKGRYF